jgi:hypothetical protein
MIFFDHQGAVMYLPFELSKLIEELKTHVPDVTKLEFNRKAGRMGQTPAQYLRDLVCLDVHGATYDELMMAHRRNVRAATQGQLAAQDRASVGPAEAQAARASDDIPS